MMIELYESSTPGPPVGPKKGKTPSDAFRDVLARIKAPCLDAGIRHSEMLEQFSFVAVRDTLIELGVSLKRAEELAANQGGCARVRLWKCVAILGMNSPRMKQG